MQPRHGCLIYWDMLVDGRGTACKRSREKMGIAMTDFMRIFDGAMTFGKSHREVTDPLIKLLVVAEVELVSCPSESTFA